MPHFTLWFWQAYQPGWRWVCFLALGAGSNYCKPGQVIAARSWGRQLANAIGVGIGLMGAFTPSPGRILDWFGKTFTSRLNNHPGKLSQPGNPVALSVVAT